MRFGYDVWHLHIFNVLDFIRAIDKLNITIFNFEKIDDDNYIFYTSVINRRKIKNMEYKIILIKSKGILSGIVSIFTNMTTFVGIASFIITCITITRYNWKVEIKGNNLILNEEIRSLLTHYGIQPGSKIKSQMDLQPIQNQMNFDLRDKLEFLYIEKRGISYEITYGKKIINDVEVEEFTNLYATKDGVIKRIEVNGGSVKVRNNQFVRTGDLLVENYIVDTRNNYHLISVKGKIWANTWYIVEVEKEINNQEDTDLYMDLLREARDQIANQITEGEYIEEENILKFETIDNKKILRIHFTLVEDISIP